MKYFLIKIATVIVFISILARCAPKNQKTEYDERLTELQESVSELKEASPYKVDSSALHKMSALIEGFDFDNMSDNQKQSFFLNELELIEIPGTPMGRTGISFSDTTDQKFSRCLSSDTTGENSQKNFAFRMLRLQSPRFDKITFLINLHIIYPSDIPNDYTEIMQRFHDQVSILNSAFSDLSIEFQINSIDETRNDFWYANVYLKGRAYEQMTKILAKEPSKKINVYVIGLSRYLGFATYPWDNAARNTHYDGIVIHPISIQNGPNHNMSGKTLVHEMGHYLGLFHVFRDETKKEDHCCRDTEYDGCNGQGDDIPDTAPQKWCHFLSCQECDSENSCEEINSTVQGPCDTCPQDDLPDMLSNYMGYAPDSCMNLFTNNQKEHLLKMIYRYRSRMIQEQYLFSL